MAQNMYNFLWCFKPDLAIHAWPFEVSTHQLTYRKRCLRLLTPIGSPRLRM